MGREPLLVLRKRRDNLSCILNNPMIWQEKIYSPVLPRAWRRAFLGCAEGELLTLSPSHLALCYIALWIIALPWLLDPAVVSHSDSEKNLNRFCVIILNSLLVILGMAVLIIIFKPTVLWI